jgi:hypothetical protein
MHTEIAVKRAKGAMGRGTHRLIGIADARSPLPLVSKRISEVVDIQ